MTQNQDEPLDPKQMEFEMEDARLILNVVRAHRVVCQLKHDLIEAKGAENLALCDLYKHRAKESGKILASAEYEVGCVRNVLHDSPICHQVLNGPYMPKRPCMSPSALSSSPVNYAQNSLQLARTSTFPACKFPLNLAHVFSSLIPLRLSG